MLTETKTDKELAKGIKNGDMLAFDSIYQKYSKKLYVFIFGILKSQKDSEDIVQDVFTKVWEKRATINEFLSFQSYLFTIAHNTSISLIRKRANETNFVSHVKSIQTPNAESVESNETEFKELKEKLEKTINELPKRQKQVYLLSREEELSYKEIAEKLGISQNTVENHMVKALKYVRSHIDSNYLSAIFIALFIN